MANTMKKATVINMEDYFRTINGGVAKKPAKKKLTKAQLQRKKMRKIKHAIKKTVLISITVAMGIMLLFGIGAAQNGDFTQGYILTGISLTWLLLFCWANADDWNHKIEEEYYSDDDYYDDYDDEY